MASPINQFSLSIRIQWQTIKTIWNSLKIMEVFPFLFYFLRERYRLQRSNFWKDWKSKQTKQTNFKNQLDLIAFFIAYKAVAGNERALILLLKILKEQTSEVFWEAVELFRKYGINLSRP
ncbi:MAG: hypothetical protein ACO1NV_01125 [Leptospira bouyouniensis]|uniref:Uncharacterized protein n=1 Tax=Leptospira bouyouniensis TaxID=2484911 RepID=A0A7I0HSM1_9LEPT|nr:hypothetical protein [Leptospira bouyouniensis]TGL06694.1 hypothetical protein EHQ43_09845 [Leptospira bouyouniensis]